MLGMGLTQLALVGTAGLLTVAALCWLTVREPDRLIRKIILGGFAAKLVGTAVYYRVIEDVYGFGDVTTYVYNGRRIAPIIRAGVLPDEARETGTRFVEFLTGVVFAVVGPSEIAAYLVFSLLSFVGMLGFLKALQLAAPDANHRRYALLLMFAPTMVYWTSTIGKDAWLVFTLGVAAYGGARALRGARFGYSLVALGVAGAGAVRPHMAALFAVSLLVAYTVRQRDPDLRGSTAGWVVGLLLLGGGAMLAVTHFSDEMGQGEVEQGSAVERLRADTTEVFESTDRNTRLGGSEFEGRTVRSPGDFLHALITVPFRPFPTEAHNIQAQLSSLEGVLLLLLTLAAIPRLMRLPRSALRSPYLAFSAAFTLGFIFAFSNFSNFGLLARQRTQLLPFLLVMLALPAWKKSDPKERAPVLKIEV